MSSEVEIPAACRPDSCAGCINAACCGKLVSETPAPVKAAEAPAKPSADAKQVKKQEETPAAADKDAAKNTAPEADKPDEAKKDEAKTQPICTDQRVSPRRHKACSECDRKDA